ncbi:MAG: preprotein translocase subunit SecE [Oscillibacter sp.]|nr:preprotein translocase subunit SecE [Oscillibacter sp.]
MADLEKKKTARTSWLRETRGELKKVVWPNRETVAKNTGTVLLCSLVIGACIWIFDFAATSLVKMILAVFGG